VLLDLGGFSITYLGGDLPAAELVRVVEAKRPRLVVLSATVAPSPAARDDLVAALSSPAMRDATVVAGGPGAASLAAAAPDRIDIVDSLEEMEEIAARIASAS
jgi:methanogenic corrinoid protein MtbC1